MSTENKINRKELNRHNCYVLNEPIISDYDFDIKLKELDLLEKNNPEFLDSNSPTEFWR